VVFSNSVGGLAATAEFDLSGTNLTLALRNIGTNNVTTTAQTLTALFFDVSGNPPITPVSARLNPFPGSEVIFSPNGATTLSFDGNVGGEWAFASALSGAPGGAKYGVSAVGFGLFDGPSFNGPNLAGTPAAVNGPDFAIVPFGVGLNFSPPNRPFIRDSVLFTFTVPSGFSLSAIHGVHAQYGTALSDASFVLVPEPGTFALVVGAAGVLCLLGRRRLRASAPTT
jgi:hypothetical protein